MYYVIDNNKGYVASQHETMQLCTDYVRNSSAMTGRSQSDWTVTKGAKDRDRVIKELKSR